MDIVNTFAKKLSDAIKNIPDGFYDTFEFTSTGKNHTHPRTLGYIVQIVWGFKVVNHVEIDIRLNVEGTKFQPDVYACNRKDAPVLIVDYESPNSSDARITQKDVIPYIKWKSTAPYIIVTTLPKKKSPNWKLRYTSATNAKHKKNIKEIRENPFEYWYAVYRKELNRYADKIDNIHFVNIDSKEARIEKLF
jgi:hypothetical protein